jgi:hypothetical protein
LGNLGSKIYATDFQNSLYNIDSTTGLATLIGSTGIPGVPYIPGSTNPDGSFNFYDEAIFGAGGKLYITYDAFVFSFDTFSVVKTVIDPKLYEVNPATGAATLVGPTDLQIGAVTGINGVYYAFNEIGQITTLDFTTGSTSYVTDFDPAAGVIQGAVAAPTPVPEPGTLTLLETGLISLGVIVRNKFLGAR